MGTSGEVSVSNGNASAGNPTIGLADAGTPGTYTQVTTDSKGRVTSGSNPTTLSGYGITDAQPLNSRLTSLSNIATTGMYAITGSGTSTTRTITAGSAKVSITNGDGVAGNPTLDVSEANLTHNNIGGTLGTAKGGTGLTSIGTTNQVLGVNSGATGLEYKSIVAGKGITVSNSAGQILVSENTSVNFYSGTVPISSGSTTFNISNTPTTANGTQIWSTTITPTSTTSSFILQFSAVVACGSLNRGVQFTLFRGTTPLTSTACWMDKASGSTPLTNTIYGTWYIGQGNGTAQDFGGVNPSNWTIFEVL